MDALKSGAIFRLKNMAVVRSPPPIPSSKGADHSIAKTVQKDDSNVVANRASDESAVIKRRFDEIYRSTPTPAAMLNRNYYWDQAPTQNTPTSSSSMQYAGTHYSAYRPAPSMPYSDSSILQQSNAVSGSMNMPPPLLPPTFTPSQFHSKSPELTALQPLAEDIGSMEAETLRTSDSTVTISGKTAAANNIDHDESGIYVVEDDNEMQTAETNISDSRDPAKSCSVGTNPGNEGLSKSRGRLAKPNILMNLTSSKPTLLSSSSSLLRGEMITVAAKSPSSSSSISTLQKKASAKLSRAEDRKGKSPEAKLSFMSNMSQTKRRRSPAKELLADNSIYSYSAEKTLNSVSKKLKADRQRFGSLTLIPMSSLLSGSTFDDYSSDDSNSSSSDSDSRVEKSAVVLESPSRDSRFNTVKSNVAGSIGRLRKMSDVLTKSQRLTRSSKLSSDSDKSEDDLKEYYSKGSTSTSSTCKDSADVLSESENLVMNNTATRSSEKGNGVKLSLIPKSSTLSELTKSPTLPEERYDTSELDRMGIAEKDAAADDRSTDVSGISEEKSVDSLVVNIRDVLNRPPSKSLNILQPSDPIFESIIEPVDVLINTVLTSSTGQAELKPKKSISHSRVKSNFDVSEVIGLTNNALITSGVETRRTTRTSTVGTGKNVQLIRSSESVTSTSTSSSSGVHSSSRFRSSSINNSGSEIADQREWTAEERIALYAAQASVDATASDFWQQVSSELVKNGVQRATEECQMKWFQTLDDTAKRRKNILLAPTRRRKGIKSKIDDIGASLSSSAECIQVPEENVKKKRLMRADIKQLAEDASKAAKADDIFEFQKDQGARTFLTVGRRNHQNSTDSTTLSQSSSSAVTNISPLKGFKILDGLEDLEDLESPNAAGVTIPHEREGRTIKRTGLRNNNASYIHTLSKKMSAKVGKSSTTGASLSSIINIKGRKGKASVNGVIGTFSPRSGKILIGIPRVVKNSGRMDEDEDEVAVDSDAYNQNLSEEEDGDF